MSDVAIHVEALGKQYFIGRVAPSDSVRDVIGQALAAPFRRAANLLRGKATAAAELNEAFWALRDVSFDVAQGEVVGIVGRNGAGKSTLLKILSRITEPDEGGADIHGHVGSLLEVGTGFHPELTGRENIFLNGAIMGMRRAETARKFDEIVDFSEVERFIDTPVKHYSSGMYLRLAFAVAAHLEPEILLVDEVLAVGDAAFQKKCLGKMGSVARAGRTVLLVSHNMSAVADLCQHAIWVDAGRVRQIGPASDVVSQYLQMNATANAVWVRPANLPVTAQVVLQSARIVRADGRSGDIVDYAQPFAVEVTYTVTRPTAGVTIAFRLINAEGVIVMESSERDSTDLEARTRPVGLYRASCRVPGGLLRHGLYYLALGVFHEGVEIIEPYREVLSYEVSTVGNPAIDGRRGVLAPIFQWSVSIEEGQPS